MDKETKKLEILAKEQEIHALQQKLIVKYFEKYNVDGDFDVMNFMWALLSRSASNFSPKGCSDNYIRKAKKDADVRELQIFYLGYRQ